MNTLHILNLCNDLHMGAMLFDDLTYRKNILFTSYKGSSQKVKSHVTAKHNITDILLAQIWHGKLCSRHINTLVIGNWSSVNDVTDNIGIRNFLNHHFNQTIIN